MSHERPSDYLVIDVNPSRLAFASDDVESVGAGAELDGIPTLDLETALGTPTLRATSGDQHGTGNEPASVGRRVLLLNTSGLRLGIAVPRDIALNVLASHEVLLLPKLVWESTSFSGVLAREGVLVALVVDTAKLAERVRQILKAAEPS